jgi:hypothetical protein
LRSVKKNCCWEDAIQLSCCDCSSAHEKKGHYLTDGKWAMIKFAKRKSSSVPQPPQMRYRYLVIAIF